MIAQMQEIIVRQWDTKDYRHNFLCKFNGKLLNVTCKSEEVKINYINSKMKEKNFKIVAILDEIYFPTKNRIIIFITAC